MATLSVVIPAYNEEDGIAEVIARVLAVRPALAALDLALELIVVDDGSRDATAAIVSQHPEARLIRQPHNCGYGAAIKTGFRHAEGHLLAFLDADGTYPPESLPELCRIAVEKNADLVVGSRMGGATSRMPLTRRLGNFAYARLLSLLGNAVVRDTASGMRVLRREALAYLYPLPDGLDFTPAMSTRAIYENLRVIEAPIPYAERVGRSKLSVVRDGLRFTNSIVWTALSYNPVRILGLGSAVSLGLALLVGLLSLALRLGAANPPDASLVYPLFGAALLGAVSVMLLSLGATFNYLVALFHKRPVRQGLLGKPIFVPPLDHKFGWMGLLAVLCGGLAGLLAPLLGGFQANGPLLWFALLCGALLVVIGIQLSLSWVIMRVLEELAERAAVVQRDLVQMDRERAL